MTWASPTSSSVPSRSGSLQRHTIYAVINIDVAEGPVVIDVPPGAIVGLLDDFWQRSLVDVGLPGPDAGNGGKFLLLPPGYDGDVPSGC
jgi:hypothetical protein